MNENGWLTVLEAARQVGVSVSTMHKLGRGRPGYHRYVTPGHRKPIVKIEQRLVDQILRESSRPAASPASASR